MCSTSHYSSKSCSHFFTTTFTFLLVLVLLPFIPSQPPHFVKDTIFTTFWELIYLFVVGIIVCYGLFSKRNSKVENVGYSSSDVLASNGSRISHVSSFFDNGGGNAHGYGENLGERFDFDEFREVRSSRLRNGVVNGRGYGENFGKRFDFDEVREPRFSRLRNGVRGFDGVCEENVGKELDGEGFVGESVGFVGNGNVEVKPGVRNGCRPLNLPVRSLKSRVVDRGSNYEDRNLEGYDKIKKVKFRGLVPINLDDKFRETIVLSPIPWGSRSGRMDLRENVGDVKPTFVGETELARPRLPAVKPLSTAVLTSEMGEFERKESLEVSFPPPLKSSLAQLKGKPSSRSSSRRFSTEVAVEKNVGDVKPTFVGEAELVRPRLPAVKPLSTAVLTSEMGEFERKESLEVSFPPPLKSSLAQLKGKPSSRSSSRRFSTEVAVEKNVGDVKPTFVGEAELVRPRLPTVKPLCTAVLTSEMEEFERKECLRVSFPPASKSSLAQLKSKLSFSRSSSRRFSAEVAVEKHTENNLKGFSKGETEDLLNTEAKGVVSLNLDVKPATLVKARSISGSFSNMTLENKSNDFRGLRKGQKEDSVCKQNKCIESSNSDVRRTRLVEGQLLNGLTSEMSNETSSDNNLKGSDKSEKGDLLRRENMSDDFWNLDLNSASVVDGRCSTASSSEVDGEKTSETIFMDFGNHKKEDLLRRKKDGSIDSLEQGVKPKTTVKGLTRGKSVRTIRSNEISVEVKQSKEVYSSHVGDRFVKHCDEDEAGLQKKSGWIDGLKSEADELGRRNRDKPSDTKTSESRKNWNGERQKNGTSTLVKSESIFVDSENFQVIADEEESRPGIIGDTHIESNEVDKKAAEFIAKFREQIRLQKVALKR
ncbi:hypothetical protein POM88_000374 [Heracleum sosnowskyi]|uniref:Uncharacterized protein n=1 Tax=Heracleum sosnowskyi TaxID=360622 RepID=A0AAD8JC68_9APIA|nr:hypothetical protein POM88_000374 [Heracleum sosnowskyi]